MATLKEQIIENINRDDHENLYAVELLSELFKENKDLIGSDDQILRYALATIIAREIISHLEKHKERLDSEDIKSLEESLLEYVSFGADIDIIKEECLQMGKKFYSDDFLNKFLLSSPVQRLITMSGDNHNKKMESILPTIENNLNLGKERYENKQYEVSIEFFDKVINIDKNNLDAYLLRGLALMHNKKYEDSISDFSKVIKINPKDFLGYYHRGYVKGFLLNKDIRDSILDYNKAIDLEENHISAIRERASLFEEILDFENAINDYDKLIEIDPEHLDSIFYKRGNCYFEKKDFEKSISEFNKSLEISKTHLVFFKRALSFNEINDYNSAISDLNSAIDLEGNNIDYFLQRGIIYRKTYEESKNKNLIKAALEDLKKVALEIPRMEIDGVNINSIIDLLEQEIGRTYYDILKVNKDASKTEIKNAWIKLMKEWHPDTNNSPDSQNMTQLLNEAYQILSNDEKRKKYDEQNP